MNSTWIVAIFLTFFSVQFILERVLSALNAAHVRAHAGAVPDAVAGLIDLPAYQKSVAYTLARARFGHVEACVDALVVCAWLFTGLAPWLASLVQRWVPYAYLDGALFLLATFFVSAVMATPLDLYGTFVLEARFGFNRTTPLLWFLDRIKAGVLGAVLGIPIISGLLWVVLHTGPLWWLWGALFVIAVQFLMMILFPAWISPLFNKFTPLEHGELRTALEALARRCNFAAQDIFVMDGSRRSAHSNAYFTGMGKTRRIVLFDTLIKQLTVPQLSAVLAHEIGHYKLRHIPKSLFLSCALTVAAFFALSRVLYWPDFYAAFGGGHWPAQPTTSLGIAQGFFICGMIVGPLSFWSGWLIHALSRKFEYEADAYAAAQTGAEPMRGALLSLSKENLSNLTPHPAYSAYHYSHPALVERLSALKV